jgi:transposase
LDNKGKKVTKKMPPVSGLPSEFEQININAAGIDIGSQKHYVAVPKGRDPEGRDIRYFDTFTGDLYALADWLKQCNINTVAMESTGIYWIPLFRNPRTKGFRSQAGQPSKHQTRAWPQERCG